MSPEPPSSQQASLGITPPRWLIPYLSRAQVWLYRRSDGRAGGRGAGMSNLLLTTIGRRSGNRHTVCLPFWVDPEGRRVVVASFSGAPHHPAWYHNLADRSANPTVDVQVMADRGPHLAQVLGGDDRTTIWDALVADRPFFADYQHRTERTIPLVRFVPAEAGA